ncbi:MAG: hypothetical protein WBR13_02165 [Allosphingosinicella sp.]
MNAIVGLEYFPRLRPAPADLPASLADVVEYRKSGLSLNHVVGCPLDCGYCVRHLFDNFEMKRPHLVMSDEHAVEQLTGHWAFRPHTTPVQLFNRATDPFLPRVKDHLMRTLELLDARELTNHVLVITRWKITSDDIYRLEQLRHVRVTVLVTWSGITDRRIEPVDSEVAEESLAHLAKYARRTKRILYWRPLIAGLNDSDANIRRAGELSRLADATVFTGLFHRQEIRAYLRDAGVEDLYEQAPRRKILPRDLEARVLERFSGGPLFRKTSCGVAFAHGVADYNGHFGVKDICDICPAAQLRLCAGAHRAPVPLALADLARTAGLDERRIEICDGRILVEDSNEQQRYFVQHSLGYQVHDRKLPHLPGRHGRAEEGW